MRKPHLDFKYNDYLKRIYRNKEVAINSVNDAIEDYRCDAMGMGDNFEFVLRTMSQILEAHGYTVVKQEDIEITSHQ